MKKNVEYARLNLTLPTKLKSEFKKFCDDNGINISSRIAVLIQEDLKNKRIRE